MKFYSNFIFLNKLGKEKKKASHKKVFGSYMLRISSTLVPISSVLSSNPSTYLPFVFIVSAAESRKYWNGSLNALSSRLLTNLGNLKDNPLCLSLPEMPSIEFSSSSKVLSAPILNPLPSVCDLLRVKQSALTSQTCVGSSQTSGFIAFLY